MKRIGVRELRQRASEYLRLVEAGETVEITDRGRPIALLTPIQPLSALERLRAAGEVIEAAGSFDDLPPALPLAPGSETASAHLARLRADER